MTRELTNEAEDERAAFYAEYGLHGNCSCHLSPPCGSCLHPGNPRNQEDASCYKPAPPAEPAPAPEVDLMKVVREFCGG